MTTCSCGTELIDGVCAHCDRIDRGPCKADCPQCQYARYQCLVCKVRFPTIPAAVHHAAIDRNNESRGNR